MRTRQRQRGSVLVALLWCLVLLSVVVLGVLHGSRLELRVARNYGDVIQARYLALAGIEKAKALLYQDAIDRKRSAKHHSGRLYDSPDDFRDVPLGRGRFRVIRQADRAEADRIIYGIADEESRLNVNTVSAQELAKILAMTPDLIAAIQDWRDGDNAVTPGGAEADYYAGLQPPRQARNGPLQSLRELLMIRGVTRELFAGEDANLNGLLDREEDDGEASFPPDNHDGALDAGWSGLFSVFSSVQNVNADGSEPVNVQTADDKALSSVRGLSQELAKAIVASRGQNRLESLVDLLEVTAPGAPAAPRTTSPSAQAPGARTAPGRAPAATVAPASATPSSGAAAGPKLISEELLLEIADELTTESDNEKPGAVNVNTAGVEVLACLPGVDRELAQAIVAYRQSAGFLPNVAWLLKVNGMTRSIFKQLAPKVTVRSETFRILSEGEVSASGARQRIEAVVRVRASDVRMLSYREDL